MKKAKMMIAGLAAALTLTFASGHAMAADISTSTPLMLRVSQWAAQECCGRRNSENCPSVCDGTGNPDCPVSCDGTGNPDCPTPGSGNGNGYGCGSGQGNGHHGGGNGGGPRLRDGSCRM